MSTYEKKIEKLIIVSKSRGLNHNEIVTPFGNALRSIGIRIKPVVFWQPWETVVFNFFILNILAGLFLKSNEKSFLDFFLMILPFTLFGSFFGLFGYYFKTRIIQKKLGVKWEDL